MPSTCLHACILTHVLAWMGYHEPGRRGRLQPAIERAVYLIVFDLHMHHETNNACLFVCLPALTSSHRQPTAV